jgi:hypothetical protein
MIYIYIFIIYIYQIKTYFMIQKNKNYFIIAYFMIRAMVSPGDSMRFPSKWDISSSCSSGRGSFSSSARPGGWNLRCEGFGSRKNIWG